MPPIISTGKVGANGDFLKQEGRRAETRRSPHDWSNLSNTNSDILAQNNKFFEKGRFIA